jgi:hypothetical protein
MLSYHQFVENKEKQEEKSGLDLDHDKEKNESPKHKAKVEEAKKKMLEFFKKRKAGAAEIAAKAKSKGGASILTYWHFAAKASPYAEVIRAIKNDESESFFMSKCRQVFLTIHCGKMKQQAFQRAMGKLEVYGEALAELFK